MFIAQRKQISGLSLPINIFCKTSTLYRMTEVWTYVPDQLEKASKIKNDPLLRLKYIISCTIASLHTAIRQLKDFNPILGETFEGVWPGTRTYIYIEQISHHPAIANFIVDGIGYKF